jgi:hypothetical protein
MTAWENLIISGPSSSRPRPLKAIRLGGDAQPRIRPCFGVNLTAALRLAAASDPGQHVATIPQDSG